MKKIYWILVGLLILFLVLYFGLTHKEKQRLFPKVKENFLEVDTSAVDKIEIKKLGMHIVFEKKDQDWWITVPENYKADRLSVNKLLESAQDIKVKNLISTNKEKQIKFQVDTLTGTRLNFFQDEGLKASVVIGKMSPDFTHAYVRKTESDEVFLAVTYLSFILNRTLKGWKDRVVFELDLEDVTAVDITRGKKKFKIVPEDTLWMVSPYPYKESFKAKREQMDQFLDALCFLITDDFPSRRDLEKLDLEKPVFHYTITLKDGTEKSLGVFKLKDQEGQYFLKKDDDDTVFLLYQRSFERIDKEIDDFKT